MFNLATYIPIFSLFFKVIYPVGEKVHKIAYNSLNADQIFPKIDCGIYL